MDSQTLMDRLEIQDVMSRYARGVDERDFDDYRSIFAEDVEIEGFGPETIRGPDAWLQFVEGVIGNYSATQHMLGPVLAEVSADRESATARTDLQAIHIPVDTEQGRLTLWGTYSTRLARGPEGWKIVWHTLQVRTVETA